MGQGRASSTSDIRIIIERPEFLLLESDEEQIDQHERELNARVMDIDVLLTARGADTCRLRFDNTDLFMFFMYVILPGNAWWVKITSNDYYEDATAVATRRFRIQRVSGYKTITVDMVSAEADLDIKKDNKFSYKNKTISEAVFEVGKRLDLVPSGLQAQDRFVQLNFITPTVAKYPSLVQSKQSDAQFLTEMAKKVGFVWWLEDETRPTREGRVGELKRSLQFKPRSFDPDETPIMGVISSDFGNTLSEVIGEPEFEIDYENNVFFGHGGTNNFWSPVRKQFQEIKNDLTTIEKTAAGQMTPVDPENQIDLASSTESFLQRQEEADKLLEAFEASLVKIRVRMVGRWDVQPRRLVRMTGFGYVVNGVMWVESIRHRASKSGVYEMELDLRANAMAISGQDILRISANIRSVRDRFKEFEDEVLFSDGWTDKSALSREKFRIWTREEVEELAQEGYTKHYSHWFNMGARK